MTKVLTETLTGTALSWAIAKCEGIAWAPGDEKLQHNSALAMQVLARERIRVEPVMDGEKFDGYWTAFSMSKGDTWLEGGTPEMAIFRCLVASRLGDEVDVPKFGVDFRRST